MVANDGRIIRPRQDRFRLGIAECPVGLFQTGNFRRAACVERLFSAIPTVWEMNESVFSGVDQRRENFRSHNGPYRSIRV